jgi:cell division protein FtsN
VAGLLVGLCVAFLVYLQMQPEQADAPTPAASVQNPDLPAANEARDVRNSKPAPIPPPPKPRFDFYDLLPEMEVIVPEEDIQGTPTREGLPQVEQPGTYLLQAGSFRSQEQADQLRASLALLGLETSVQSVSASNNQSWHRVRVGPYSNLQDLNQARSLLKSKGIDAILIRIKG